MIINKVDRLKLLIRYVIRQTKSINQQELGIRLGYSNPSYFSQIINCKVETPIAFIDKIKSLCPEINVNWILNGEGDMLNSTMNNENDNQIISLNLKSEISDDKSVDNYAECSRCNHQCKNADIINKALISITKIETIVDRQMDIISKQFEYIKQLSNITQ